MSGLFDTFAGGGGPQKYEVGHSVRLRASADAYLNRTPGAGNRTTWTWSGWIKRGALGVSTPLICCGSATTRTIIYFNPTDSIAFLNSIVANVNTGFTGTAKFRDPSAHYHVVAVWDTSHATANERLRVFVNGVRAVGAYTTVALNELSVLNSAQLHRIGENSFDTSGAFDGYLSEINFVDGQALAPDAFGEQDANGVWVPKKYAGTYGNNGFYLPFSNGSSLANLTADASGNGNNWTANNISLTAGQTYDWMTDTPTNNYATLNPLHPGTSVLSNGNLTCAGASIAPTILPSSGTWYLERGGVALTWTPPAAFPAAAGDYNFGQRPFANTPTALALCTANLSNAAITQNSSFTGNANADGPYVWLNGNPETMTINGNAVTWGTHADKVAGGFKVKSAASGYNAAGSNTFAVSIIGEKFGSNIGAPNNAQVNP